MAVVSPANPRDVQDFQFKLLCRLRIFTGEDGTFTNAVNLVAAASKYGLMFVGCPTGLQVITLSSIINLENPSGGNAGEITNYPRREVPLPSQPSHIGVSCDQNFLVIAMKKNGCAHALIYSVTSFLAVNIIMVNEVRLSTKSDTSVLELTWNPGIPNILAACLSDGSMATYELKTSAVDISTLPPATQANCFCWSPKGKQLVVGSEAGTLTQYKPDLKQVKTFSPPNLGSGNVSVVNVLWLSNYQFAAIYRDKMNGNERPGLLIVNAPKTGTLTFVNYEDICYSAGELRPPQFYLIHQPTWNILMVASANSMEVGVMGLQEDQISWEQWNQEDAARAELPLSVHKQETFPVGLGLDTSTQQQLSWGENQSLAPMPVLHILSHQGVLCLFYAINLRPGAAPICLPPEKLPDVSGLALFTSAPSGSHTAQNKVPLGATTPAILEQGAGDSAVKIPDQSSTQSGTALTLVDASLGGMRVNLAQKFESVGTPQPTSSFGYGTTMTSTTPSGFGSGFTNNLSTGFGVGLTGAPASGFGTGLTGTPTHFGSGLTNTSTGFGASLSGAPSTGFGTGLNSVGFGSKLVGAPSAGFGTGINNSSPTAIGSSLSNTSTNTFATVLNNPPSALFGTGQSNPSSINFGAQPTISTSSAPSNPPNIVFGVSSATVSAPKPSFSFLPTPVTGAAPPAPGLKSTPAANFTFAASALPTGQVTQQPTKPVTSSAVSHQQIMAVKPQMNLLGSSSGSSEQVPGSSVTIMKVPAAIVPPSQPVRVETPGLDVKQIQVKLAPSPVVVAPTKPVVSPAVSDSVFFNAINEEVVHFERELKELRSRVSGINVQVGSNDEKILLRQKADMMEEFWRELKDTTHAQSSEIHALKSVIMEAFAWTEEAKSRIQQLNSPMYIQLARSQALDPVSARYAINVKHLVYYVENQLRQVNEQLDSKWLEFQDSCKPSVKNKMHIPSLESVYQAMVMQNNILNKQRAIMADIARRAQEQGRSTQIPLISSAVLARVRDKEALQLGKGETELSRLAENLVKMNLGPPDAHLHYRMSLHYRRLSRKKESLLRDVLSQSAVTRVCPTKLSRSSMGGISTGKPVVAKIETSTSLVSSEMSRLAANAVVTEPIIPPPVVNLVKSDMPQASLFSFGTSKTSGELDTASKGFANRSFSLLGSESAATASKEALSGVTMTASGGIIAPIVDITKAKHSIPDSTVTSKHNVHTSVLGTKASSGGDFSFSSSLQSGKSSTPASFSFAQALNKVPSLGKLNDTSRKLEDYYEELTPPGTPEHSHKEIVPSAGSNVSSNSFTFNFAVTPNSAKTGIVPLGSASGINNSLQKSPLMSLDSIVAGIGDGSNTSKAMIKPVVDSKHVTTSNVTSALVTTSFSFSSMSFNQQQGGSLLGKVEEQKKPSDVFKFSLTSSPFGSVSTPLPSVTSSGDTSPKTQPTSPIGSHFKTTFGSLNFQGNTSPQVNIFGGGEVQKPSLLFVTSGSSPVLSSSASTFGQVATPVFGNVSMGSPAKQPASSINIFGGTPVTSTSTSLIFGKQSTDSSPTADTTTSEAQHKPESPAKVQPSAVTSSATENLFSQSTSLFGSLSVGSGGTSKPAAPENVFVEGSTPLSTSFMFGKQPTTTESSNVVEPTPEADTTTAAVDSTGTEMQKAEPSSKDPQISVPKPVSKFVFVTPGADKPESSEDVKNQQASSTSLFGNVKTEATTAATFSFAQLASVTPPTSSPATSTLFGQTPATVKPLTGSIFGAAPTTTQQMVATTSSTVTTSSATQTTAVTSTTFSFSLPASTPSPPLGQKSPGMFGQVSSTAPATAASGSFFGQAVCSPTAFGQSGANVFGQPPATTATAKANVFGQAAATTTTPSVFGQGTTNTMQSMFGQSSPVFGQASSAGSSFLSGGSTGGFGSKPAFGQSGGSIFGQSSSTGFGTSGGPLFGGGSGGGPSVFGGSAGTPPSGALFQSSTGGSIFGGTSSPGSGSSTGGAFSSGMGQSISQSGFGSPTAFQSKPGGFGGSPVFDRGASGFGAPPTFGGTPTFGGSPTFGSPGKVFGSTSPTATVGFGSPVQQSSTFEILATQNTMTFGNLAQNQSPGFGSPTQSVFGATQTQQPPSPPAFSAGGSAFGGSSFSSWR